MRSFRLEWNRRVFGGVIYQSLSVATVGTLVEWWLENLLPWEAEDGYKIINLTKLYMALEPWLKLR